MRQPDSFQIAPRPPWDPDLIDVQDFMSVKAIKKLVRPTQICSRSRTPTRRMLRKIHLEFTDAKNLSVCPGIQVLRTRFEEVCCIIQHVNDQSRRFPSNVLSFGDIQFS